MSNDRLGLDEVTALVRAHLTGALAVAIIERQFRHERAVQGIGTRLLLDGREAASIHKCIPSPSGEQAWSVTVDEVWWRLPKHDLRRLMSWRGLVQTTYVNTEPDAIKLAMQAMTKRLEWTRKRKLILPMADRSGTPS